MAEPPPYDKRRLLLVLDAVVLYLVACGVFVVVRGGGLLPSALAIAAVAALGVWLTRVIRLELRNQPVPLRIGVPLVAVPVVVGVALIWLWDRTDRGDGWGFLGAATFYLGLGLIVSQVRHSERWSHKIGVRVAILSGGALVAAVIALSGGEGWGAMLLVLGVAAGLLAVSLLSADSNRSLEDEEDPARAVRLAGVGAVLVVVALVFLIMGVDVGWSYVLLFALFVFALVLAVAARSNADVVLVVVAIAVVWATAQTSAPVTEELTAEPGERVLVALGDSFMSGEGADTFLERTNTKGENECRRAPTAYPARVVRESSEAVPDDVIFLACSGARATHIHEVPQHPGEPIDGPLPAEATPPDGTVSRGLPQLDNLLWQLERAGLTQNDIALVVLSIGGNDALFGDVAQACVLPGDCSAVGQAWIDNLETVRPLIATAYEAVRTTLPTTPVVVIPYPIPIEIEKRGCDYSMFSAAEHRFLNGFTQELNAMLREEAADKRFYFLDEMAGALEDRQLCDGDPDDVGVNFLAANGVYGLMEQQANPRNWFHNSMHPNEYGHEAMTVVLRDWLEAEGELHAVAPVDSPAPAGTPPTVGRTCVEDPDLRACAAEWSLTQQAAFLLFPGSFAVVLVLGSWFLALALIRVWRRRDSDRAKGQATTEGPTPATSRRRSRRLGGRLTKLLSRVGVTRVVPGVRDFLAWPDQQSGEGAPDSPRPGRPGTDQVDHTSPPVGGPPTVPGPGPEPPPD